MPSLMNAGITLQPIINQNKKMKQLFFVLLSFVILSAGAQSSEAKFIATVKEFHQALVQKNIKLIHQLTDDALTYGHSTGWIQTKTDLVKDFESGMITYHSYKEDSIVVGVSGNAAHIRFIADINSTLRGNNSNNHIKVMEVWIKKGEGWVLFARQAIRSL